MSKTPIVSHRSIGTGFGFSISPFNAFTGIANPKLSVRNDFKVNTPTTSPRPFNTGPPLFPRSIGNATCSIGTPSISTSRIADTTPSTTLNSNPSGFPIATSRSPCSINSESPILSAFNPFSFTFKSAKSSFASVA